MIWTNETLCSNKTKKTKY